MTRYGGKQAFMYKNPWRKYGPQHIYHLSYCAIFHELQWKIVLVEDCIQISSQVYDPIIRRLQAMTIFLSESITVACTITLIIFLVMLLLVGMYT